MKINKLSDSVVLICLSLFAYRLTFLTGERGLFAFDQSVIFDGAYRIVSGQVPYKDFVLLHGFFASVVQSLFFMLRGVNYGAYICGAAVINVFATLLSIWIVRRFFPGQKALSYVSGLLTAIFFYPPFGTPWGKQTGFFFGMAGLCFIARGVLGEEPSEQPKRDLDQTTMLFAFLAGVMTMLSFLSYQGVGILVVALMLFFLAGAYLLGYKKSLFCFAGFGAGVAASGLGLTAWVLFASDWGNFWKYSVQLPMRLVEDRASPESWGRFLEALLMGFTKWVPSKPMLIPPPVKWLPFWIRISILFFYLTNVLFLFKHFKSPVTPLPGKSTSLNGSITAGGGTLLALAALLSFALIHFQYAFMYINLNHPMNGLPFIGIIVAFGLGLLPGLFRFSVNTSVVSSQVSHLSNMINRSGRIFVIAGSFVFLAALSISGFLFAIRRFEHPTFRMFPALFGERFEDEKLKALRWGQPTMVTQVLRNPHEVKTLDVTREDFNNLLKYLRSGKKNFFVFPDFSILYGLTGAPSPQPLLWFHKGTIYMDPYDPKLDQWVVDGLIRNQVKLVILEEESYHGTKERLADFPLLGAYIEKNFKFVEKIGIFNIYDEVRM